MSAPLPIVVNAGGGRARREGAALAQRLQDAAAQAGVEVDVALVEGDEIADAIRERACAPVIAVGGGDGTQGLAATILKHGDTALAVLPLGTLNHLARQMGVPDDLPGALAVAANGTRSEIDLGCVGDTVFVNNASLGIYTHMVRRRDASALPKWLATVPAAWGVMRRIGPRRIRIDTGEVDGERAIRTPLLFVGNNRYRLNGKSPGERTSLCDGVLSVYAVAPKTALQLLWFGVRALAGRADPHRDFVALAETGKLTVLGEGEIDVAHDGEVTRMNLPLTFNILPRALTVMMPADQS